MFKLCILVVLLFGVANSANWNDFRVKYDLNPIGHFNRMPKTEEEAKSLGWTSIVQNFCDDGQYLGYRYIIRGDNSLVLIYDVNGIIAGLQMLLPHSDMLSPQNTFKFGEVSYFNNATFNGAEYFILTAYIVDPEIICTTGRSEADLITVGTGEGVWIQDGRVGKYLEIPDKREDAVNSGWSNNNCFIGMGTHSWYRMEDYEATNCDEQVPVFGLWNRASELQGFGFSIPGTTVNAHFENPPLLALQMIAGDPAPQCLFDKHNIVGTTTMHVYFVDTPWFIQC